MDMDDLKKQIEEKEEMRNAYNQGFKYGEENAKKEIKYNKIIQTLLLEFIGYEDEWLTTTKGYKRYNKSELIEIILKQRALMKTLYNEIEESKKEKIKIKIEKFFWPTMHQDL